MQGIVHAVGMHTGWAAGACWCKLARPWRRAEQGPRPRRPARRLTASPRWARGTLYVDPSLADKLGRFPDSYLSVAGGWNKGLIFINGYNIVRRLPSLRVAMAGHARSCSDSAVGPIRRG